MDFEEFRQKYEPMLKEIHAEWSAHGRSFQPPRAPADDLPPDLVAAINAPLPTSVTKGHDFSDGTASVETVDPQKKASADAIAAKRKTLVERGAPQAEVDALTDDEIAQCPDPETRSPTDPARIAQENAAEAADVAKRTGTQEQPPQTQQAAPPAQQQAQEQPTG